EGIHRRGMVRTPCARQGVARSSRAPHGSDEESHGGARTSRAARKGGGAPRRQLAGGIHRADPPRDRADEAAREGTPDQARRVGKSSKKKGRLTPALCFAATF